MRSLLTNIQILIVFVLLIDSGVLAQEAEQQVRVFEVKGFTTNVQGRQIDSLLTASERVVSVVPDAKNGTVEVTYRSATAKYILDRFNHIGYKAFFRNEANKKMGMANDGTLKEFDE